MTEKEVKSILLNKLNFSQDSLYKLDAFCHEVLEYNKNFNLRVAYQVPSLANIASIFNASPKKIALPIFIIQFSLLVV